MEGESPGGEEYVRIEGGVHHSNPYSVPLSPASALREQQEGEEEEEEGGTGSASGGGGSKGRVYTSSGLGVVVGGISNRGDNSDDDIIGADEGNAGSVSTTGIRINSGGSTDDYGGGSGSGAGAGGSASRVSRVFDLDPPIMKGDVVDFIDRKSGQRRRGVVDFIYDRIGEVDVKVLPDGATTGGKGGKLHTGIKSSSVTVRMRPDSAGAGGSGGGSGGGAVGNARAGVHSMRVWDPFGYGGGASSSDGKGLITHTTGSTGNEGNRGSGGNGGKGIVHYQAALLTSTGGGDTGGGTGGGTGGATPSHHGDRGDGVDGGGDTDTHTTGESAKVVRQRAVRGDAEATVSSLARQAALSERGWGVGPQQQRYWPATGLTKAVRSITQMHLRQGTMAQAEPLIQVRSCVPWRKRTVQ